jgi:hypothetical protein
MLEETGKIEVINDNDEVSDLEEFDDEHEDKPKLIVFDDFLNVEKKKMKKIYISTWLVVERWVSQCG